MPKYAISRKAGMQLFMLHGAPFLLKRMIEKQIGYSDFSKISESEVGLSLQGKQLIVFVANDKT